MFETSNAPENPFIIVQWKDNNFDAFSPDNNRALSHLLEMEIDEFKAKTVSFNSFIHPIDRLTYIQETITFLDQQLPYQARLPYRILLNSGRVIWIQETLLSSTHPDVLPETCKSVMLDITMRMKNLELEESTYLETFSHRIREKGEISRCLIDKTPVAVLMHQEGKWIYVNSRATEISGYSEREILSMNFWDFVHPDYIDFIKDQGSKRYGSGKALDTYQLKIITKQGDEKWVELYGESVSFQDKPAGMLSVIDCTERMKSLEKLKESEERYSFLSSMTIEALVTHKQGKVVDINTSFEKLSGYSRKEAVGRSIFECFTFDEYHKSVIEQHVRTNSVTPYIVKGKNRYGRSFWIEIEGRTAVYDGEELRCASLRDLTEQKLAERKIEYHAKLIDALLNKSSVSILIHPLYTDSRTGNYILVNDATCRSLGYSREELIHMTPLDILVHESEEDGCILQAALKELQIKGFSRFIAQYRAKNRKLVVHELSMYRIRLDNEMYVMVFSQDIEERLRTEKLVKEERDLLLGLIDNMLLGVCVVGPDNSIQLINDQFTQITGYTLQEIPNLEAWLDIVYPDPEYRKKIIEDIDVFIHQIGQGLQENTIVCADGSQKTLEYRIRLLEDKRVIICFTDITDRYKQIEQINKLQRLEGLGTLAGGIAHDFNNILTGIFGNISLASLLLDETSPANQYLLEAENSLDRAKRLTSKLLTFSKGGTPIQSVLSLGTIIRDVVAFDLSGSSIIPVFSIPEELWTIGGDLVQIEQVFSNLTINAKQAMGNGGHIYITCKNIPSGMVTDSTLPDSDYIQISFSDEGNGINPSCIDKIFEPYFTTKEHGSGLGLATSFSIISKHRGKIFVEKTSKYGTTFVIYLPRYTPSSESSSQTEARDFLQKNHTEVFRVLVMDDDEQILSTITEMLISLGFRVDSVMNGHEALHLLRTEKMKEDSFTHIILDLTIPGGVGGKEIIEEVLSIEPAITAIVSSGYADAPIMSHYKEYGFSDVLEKPYTLKKLQQLFNIRA